MKRNQSFIFLSLIAIVFSSSSCHRKEPIVVVPSDSEFLSYFYFPNGGTWIYKKSNSSALDTVLTFNFNSLHLKNQEFGDQNVEYDLLQYNERVLNDTIGVGVWLMGYDKDSNDALWTRRDTRSIDDYGYNFFKHTVIHEDTLDIIPYPEGLTTKDKADSMLIHGVIYFNIVHVRNLTPFPSNNINEIWYAKNIGVLKRKFFDGTEWELIDYHLN